MNEHYIKSIDENELFNQLINYCEIFKNKIIGEKKDKIKKTNDNIVFKTIKNKKSFNIIHIKGKNFNILKLWKSINKTLRNKHKRITQNNDCHNFIETFEWYKDNFWMIKKKKYPIK